MVTPLLFISERGDKVFSITSHKTLIIFFPPASNTLTKRKQKPLSPALLDLQWILVEIIMTLFLKLVGSGALD